MSESFSWTSPSLSSSHFHALANLLSLRNGGQAEPSSLSAGVALEDDFFPNEDCEDGDYAHSIATDVAHRISGSGYGKLKRKFLDCLAEFAASKKGGMEVACAAMEEAEDNVIVWIARNEGFAERDQGVFEKLGKVLGALAGDVDVDSLVTSLWEEMISYHRSRIEQDHIPNLRASFKALEAGCTINRNRTSDGSLALYASLSALRTLLFEGNLNDLSILEKHKRLVAASYNLRRTKHIEGALNNSASATSKSKSLWFNICSLARLRVALNCFKDISLALPSFAQVSIVLIPRPMSPAHPSQRPLDLNKTFAILKLEVSPATTKAVLGHNWTVDRTKREFVKRQKQKFNIHAEIQMLIFMNSEDSSGSKPLPYFGCSKLSCFMCHHFLQAYGRYTTRGCHGRLFKPWTVPCVDGLLPGRADRIARALITVQKEVRKQLKSSVGAYLQHQRTSVVGASSVSSSQQEQRSERQLQLEHLKVKATRDRVKEMFRRKREESRKSAMCKCSTLENELSEPEDECSICSKLTTRRCSTCNKGFFCSDACQAQRSGSHLFGCSKRPLTSADYLWKSLAEDRMPKEEDVLEDFGFNAFNGTDLNYLLGVYKGLYLSDEIQVEDINDWRVAGILIEKIKDFYFGIPEGYRGQYFPWFLRNCHLIEHPVTKDEAHRKLTATFYDKAKPYLDREDRDKPAADLEPEAKRESYCLLAQILMQFSPNPIQKIWYSFGFATCSGRQEESELVSIYQLLLIESDETLFYKFHNRRRGALPPATFEQFWKAYEAGTLIQLIDSKGLGELRARLPFLEDFLSEPPHGMHLSIWDLKQFLEIGDPAAYPPIPPISVDYGFINCHTLEEICILMEIYGRVLTLTSPLKLHRACVMGLLFELASSCVEVEERWRPLLENPYPLETVIESELE